MIPSLEELPAAQLTFQELDRAYQDGIEDLADKILTLIQQSDYTIELDELETFLDAEKGFGQSEDFKLKLPEPAKPKFVNPAEVDW